MTVRALVVDDERLPRVALAALLRERPDVTLLGEADSVASAAKAVEDHDPDVVFLDVRMRDGSGFDVLGRVPVRGHVVFVTAYRDHAVRAFEVAALDYLLKPVRSSDLDRALARVRDRGSASVADEPLELKEGLDSFYATPGAIRFLRAARDYTEVHLATGEMRLVRHPLAGWEERLPHSFLRIHRSVIVNVDHLDAVVRREGAWQVRLRGVREPFGVSRRLLAGVRARLEAGV